MGSIDGRVSIMDCSYMFKGTCTLSALCCASSTAADDVVAIRVMLREQWTTCWTLLTRVARSFCWVVNSPGESRYPSSSNRVRAQTYVTKDRDGISKMSVIGSVEERMAKYIPQTATSVGFGICGVECYRALGEFYADNSILVERFLWNWMH